MLKNYLKIAFRNFKKRKGFSFINIVGLGVGIACCGLIFLWVQNQLSYDRFHENSNYLYGAYFSNGSNVTPPALANFLKSEYSQILNASRFCYAGRTKFKYQNKEMMESGGAFVDPSFLDMFTLNFYKGDSQAALKQPMSIVLTESFVSKYFGTKDPLGETLTAYGRDFNITGVIKDYPITSHIQFKFLLPFELHSQMGRDLNNWETNWHQTYVQLHPEADLGSVNKKIAHLVKEFDKQELRTLLLRPITRLHLYQLHGGGRITIVTTFSIIAIFILLIACINFINLSTAQSSLRMKEVGMRKTIGAHKKELVIQFFIETFLLIFIAWLVGLVVLRLFLPEFNMLVGEQFTFESLVKWPVMSGIIGLLLLSGLMAGSYPALVISSFKPVDTLKGTLSRGTKGAVFGKGLVVFQFILSIALIFSTLVLSKQLEYLRNVPLGFDKEHVVTFRAGDRIKSFSAFKNTILGHTDVVNITTTNIPPYRWNTNAGLGDVHWQGQEYTKIKMVETTVDYDYAKTFGLKIMDGRFFSSEHLTDVNEAWVVNEAAVRAMGIKSPVGKWLRLWDNQRTIIGVVKDYNFESLRSEIIPMAMRLSSHNPWACIKIKGHNIPATLEFIKGQWKIHSNNYPFEYNFLSEQIDHLYITEERMGTLFKYFSILAIIISCMGLFGLASFYSQRRTKEIGVRKVLGSSTAGLLILLSKNFIKWVVYAMLIAWPLTWLLMNKLLQLYAYKIKIDWVFFVVSGGLAMIIAVFTISFQIIKAARANPVESLRYE